MVAPGRQAALCVGKISVGIELTHHELQILGKDGSLPTPPRPSHFLKVRFLSALTVSIPNPPPYIPLQICLTIVKKLEEKNPHHLPLQSHHFINTSEGLTLPPQNEATQL